MGFRESCFLRRQLDKNGFEGLFAYLLNCDDIFCNAQKLDAVKGCIFERAAERFIQSTDVFFYHIICNERKRFENHNI